MKLIKEFGTKIIIIIIIFVLSMEIGIFLFLLANSGNIFLNVYNQTIINSKEKTINITNKIQLYIRNLLIKQTTDLKLICKHATLLNGKKIYNSKTIIDKNSNLIINSNKSKQIIYAKTEINKDEYINKYFN